MKSLIDDVLSFPNKIDIYIYSHGSGDIDFDFIDQALIDYKKIKSRSIYLSLFNKGY
jgi:hypothetical protein